MSQQSPPSPESPESPESTRSAESPAPAAALAAGNAASEAVELRMATFRLARRLRAERAVESISDAQFGVLARLKVIGTQTLTELASGERVTAPSMNRTVNCLEGDGLVERTPNDDDRRKFDIALTDRGREIVTETTRRRDAWLEEALGALTPDERAALHAAAPIMRKLAER